jgi:hypothetical protein
MTSFLCKAHRPQAHVYIKDKAFGLRIRPPDRNGDAARRVDRRKARDHVSRSEVCASAFPFLVQNACDPRDTSRQSNTHSTELREVRYPWHPWYGRLVSIHGALAKSGRAVYRCSLEQNHEARLFEIPQWMFESGACCRMHSAENPAVEWLSAPHCRI